MVRICIRYILKQRKKLQAAATFRDNEIGFLRFFVTKIFSHLANNFSLRTTKFCQNQPKGKLHKQEKSHDAATYMKVAMKVFPGLSLCGAHCSIQVNNMAVLHLIYNSNAYPHHRNITIHSLLRTSSTLLGRPAGPNPSC